MNCRGTTLGRALLTGLAADGCRIPAAAATLLSPEAVRGFVREPTTALTTDPAGRVGAILRLFDPAARVAVESRRRPLRLDNRLARPGVAVAVVPRGTEYDVSVTWSDAGLVTAAELLRQVTAAVVSWWRPVTARRVRWTMDWAPGVCGMVVARRGRAEAPGLRAGPGRRLGGSPVERLVLTSVWCDGDVPVIDPGAIRAAGPGLDTVWTNPGPVEISWRADRTGGQGGLRIMILRPVDRLPIAVVGLGRPQSSVQFAEPDVTWRAHALWPEIVVVRRRGGWNPGDVLTAFASSGAEAWPNPVILEAADGGAGEEVACGQWNFLAGVPGVVSLTAVSAGRFPRLWPVLGHAGGLSAALQRRFPEIDALTLRPIARLWTRGNSIELRRFIILDQSIQAGPAAGRRAGALVESARRLLRSCPSQTVEDYDVSLKA
jgi:hypothetical protein